MKRCVGCFLLLLSSIVAAEDRLPIIDMHMHAFGARDMGPPPPLAMCTPMKSPAWDPAQPYGTQWVAMAKEPPCDDPIWSPETDEEVVSRTIEIMERRNIYGVLSGTPGRVKAWRDAAPGRFYQGIGFQIGGPREYPVETLKKLHEAGKLDVFAEIVNQYMGIEPDDERMDAYWAMAEELEIPVGIHIGTGPPGVIYLYSPNYRARMHSPLTLEEVLVRHPRLRIYIMHAGYPMLDDLLAVMFAHPQVYVEVGIIVHTIPRPAFYRFLKGITDAGYGNRVMFGSDQMIWPESIERGLAVIEEAPFLDDDQIRDILYNNAARFLRLSEEEIARHHGR
ncbi:MAG: amidohydrolase family protein [Woeseiaceae bacterium]|nr:amidohydrolase family protein [Woeseiaceae bacterium]